MDEYTPSIDELREAWLSAEFEERDCSTSDDDLRAEFDRALAAHDAEVRAQVVAEEPEWEYGISTGWGRVDWRGSREYVEGTVKDFETAGAPLRDGQEVVRRRMAGPWVEVTDA